MKKTKAIVLNATPWGIHKSCNERWAAKCNWEKRTRSAILKEYKDIICRACRKKVELADLRRLARHIKEGECWVCKCTQNKACNDGGRGCGWTDATRTLCTVCRKIADRVELLIKLMQVR